MSRRQIEVVLMFVLSVTVAVFVWFSIDYLCPLSILFALLIGTGEIAKRGNRW